MNRRRTLLGPIGIAIRELPRGEPRPLPHRKHIFLARKGTVNQRPYT